MAGGSFIADIVLKLRDQVAGPIRKILARLFDVENAGKKASKAFKLAADMKQSADAVKGFADGVIGAVGKPIRKMMEFEEIMSSVRAKTFNGVLTEKTKKEFQELAASARQLGADTKYSGVEVAEGYVNLATAGFDAAQQMAAMPGILNLAAASNESIAVAAEISANAMSQFGLEATDMGRIGDVIQKTADSTQTGLLDIGEALAYAGKDARNAGIEIEKTTAMIGALGNVGVKGSAAGTTLRSIFSSLQAPSAKAKSALQFLGINTKDKAGNLRPIEQLLAEIDKAMDRKFGKGKGGNRRANILKGLFDEANASNASLLIAQAGSGELNKFIAANMDAAGTAARVAADMSNNTVGAAKELDSAWEELQLTAGEMLIPTVRDLLVWTKSATESFTSWTKAHPDLTRNLGLATMIVGGLGVGVWGIVTAVSAAYAVYGTYNKVLELSKAGMAAWTTVQKAAAAATGVTTKALNIMKLTMLSNPLTAIILGVATAAALIYTYWEPISGFFVGLWGGVKSTFDFVWKWIVDKIEWAGGKVAWLKEDLLGIQAGMDYTKIDSGIQEQLGKLSKEQLQTVSQGTGMVAEAARAKIGMERLKVAAPEMVVQAKAAATSALSSIMHTGSPAANGAPALAATPLLPELPAGAPIMPTLPGGGSFRGELTINVRGAQVESSQLKTAGDPGFVVRMNTGTQ